MPLHLPEVELIAVDGRGDAKGIILTLNALKKCAAHASFHSVKLLSPVKPELPDFITYVPIRYLADTHDYCGFMVAELGEFVEARFCLSIHWDGFIIRPEKWNPRFLDYDYIGAPWPPEWKDRNVRVGNGGFSLRSKRLLELGKDLDFSQSTSGLEDNFLCIEQRDFLLSKGIKYAPPEIAVQFSWENPVPEGQRANAFGIHGKHEANIADLRALHAATRPDLKILSHDEEHRLRRKPLNRIRKVFGLPVKY